VGYNSATETVEACMVNFRLQSGKCLGSRSQLFILEGEEKNDKSYRGL
jgi:hypothetical protein